jgi:hypothetical protein
MFAVDHVQSWLTSLAWSESLMFSESLFFFTTSVSWIGLMYRYAKLDAFAVHRSVLVGLEVDDDEELVDKVEKVETAFDRKTSPAPAADDAVVAPNVYFYSVAPGEE